MRVRKEGTSVARFTPTRKEIRSLSVRKDSRVERARLQILVYPALSTPPPSVSVSSHSSGQLLIVSREEACLEHFMVF